MHHFSTLPFNDKEGIERTEEEIGDWQEVAGARPVCAWFCKKVPQV
jgi:hypothetical protein